MKTKVITIVLLALQTSLARADKTSPAPSTDDTFARCVKILRHGSNFSFFKPQKSEAAVTLGLLREERAIPVLAEQLESEEDELRRNVTRALGWLRSAKAAAPLQKALVDKDKYVRSHAAIGLGMLEDAKFAPVLEAALKDKASTVRQAAAEALGKLGEPRTVPALLSLLAREKDGYVRCEVMKALAETKSDKAVPALEEALKDESLSVRICAANALRKITGRDYSLFDDP